MNKELEEKSDEVTKTMISEFTKKCEALGIEFDEPQCLIIEDSVKYAFSECYKFLKPRLKQWMPIDKNTPKDGTLILVKGHYECSELGQGDIRSDKPMVVCWDGYTWEDVNAGYYQSWAKDPTHWCEIWVPNN